ncbi:MAG: ribosome-associated translation inhibitor RaiA [Candidatus Theseobacter exili]|nr:ribosome-associated translation inhibitor RaiA [Candidatus Theseobacter exili]
MTLTVTGRHIDITEAMKLYAREKLEKILKNIPKVSSVHVIMDIQKYTHQVEVNIKAMHFTASATEKSEDMYCSIDKVTDKLERQLKKYKDKLQSHRPRKNEPFKEAAVVFDTDILEEIEEKPKIVCEKKLHAKPMFIDDALSLLEDSTDDFLLFRNAETERVNLLCRRKQDRDLELLELNL